MDKIKKILLVLVVVLLINTNVYAKETEEDYYGTFKITEEYLKRKNVKTYDELSIKDQKELFRKIDKIKSRNIIITRSSSGGNNENINKDIKTNISYYGDIFVTMDNKTLLRHGHAGIGGFAEGSVVEANPGKGVTIEKNGVHNWRKYETGGIMRVRGASVSDYRKAARYAESKEGYEYSLISESHTFYCSELVYFAWKEAGYDICSYSWGTHYSPYDIINDNDTYYIHKWIK